MNNDLIVLKLLSNLVEIQKSLDQEVIKLKCTNKFKDVNRQCGIINYFANDNPAISFSINADLIEPIDNDLHSLGLSFTVFKKNDYWCFQGEVGWSSYNLGFDEENSIEENYNDLETLLSEIHTNKNTLLNFYRALTIKNPIARI